MVKRRTLKKSTVLETAARLANQSGDVTRVTLTQLAAELDIRVPSLYNHIKGLDGLYQDLTYWGLQMALASTRQAIAGKVGRDALVAIAHAYRNFAHAQPGIYPLIVRAPDPNDTELVALSTELVSLLQLILASYGIQGDEALHAIRGFRSLLHGFVSLETSGGFGLPLDLDESFEKLLMIYIDGLQA